MQSSSLGLSFSSNKVGAISPGLERQFPKLRLKAVLKFQHVLSIRSRDKAIKESVPLFGAIKAVEGRGRGGRRIRAWARGGGISGCFEAGRGGCMVMSSLGTGRTVRK